MKRVNVRDILKKYRNDEKIVSLSLYDSWMASLADQSETDILLVGDSLGMTVLGYDSTVPVTMDDCLRHTAAVVRGSQKALVIGDLPFASYSTFEDAMKNSSRFLQEAGAGGVKLEGGELVAPIVEKLVQNGVPVMGHIGILPQSFKNDGYRVKGKSKSEAIQLVADAKSLEAAGAFSIVLEGVAADVARIVTNEISIPTIGIGAGAGCSGQIQVAHDILGLIEGFQPKHAKQFANLSETIKSAFLSYSKEISDGSFPGDENTF
ncbi:MAG: 3-methyl-2-oxobutanoate hydroxymethyltransferase [Lentisphaeraceae bacterium]|nr:3-methyl-2-oxobutanoate hydroxymethyltransferase [Lentisphaeraceae bacterium]